MRIMESLEEVALDARESLHGKGTRKGSKPRQLTLGRRCVLTGTPAECLISRAETLRGTPVYERVFIGSESSCRKGTRLQPLCVCPSGPWLCPKCAPFFPTSGNCLFSAISYFYVFFDSWSVWDPGLLAGHWVPLYATSYLRSPGWLD